MDWIVIVIDNPKSKSDFGFGLSIQFCHFNPNPKYQNYFNKKFKFHSASCSKNEPKPLLNQRFQTSNLLFSLSVDKRCLLGIQWFYHKILPSYICYHISFSKNSWIVIGMSIHFENWIWIWIVNHIFLMDLDWIDNPK